MLVKPFGPHQRASWDASANAWKTRSRGAWIRREVTSARSAAESRTDADRSGMPLVAFYGFAMPSGRATPGDLEALDSTPFRHVRSEWDYGRIRASTCRA